MDRPVSATGTGGTGGTIPKTCVCTERYFAGDRWSLHRGTTATPQWGCQETPAIVHQRHPRWDLPGRSTVCDILKRHGMVPKKRYRRHIGHPGKPTSQILAPNEVWSADFKGQFKTGDGHYCYPLTVTDGFSRFLLGCQALSSTSVEEAKAGFPPRCKGLGFPPPHPHRQRGTICHQHLSAALTAFGVVGTPRHLTRV